MPGWSPEQLEGELGEGPGIVCPLNARCECHRDIFTTRGRRPVARRPATPRAAKLALLAGPTLLIPRSTEECPAPSATSCGAAAPQDIGPLVGGPGPRLRRRPAVALPLRRTPHPGAARSDPFLLHPVAPHLSPSRRSVDDVGPGRRRPLGTRRPCPVRGVTDLLRDPSRLALPVDLGTQDPRRRPPPRRLRTGPSPPGALVPRATLGTPDPRTARDEEFGSALLAVGARIASTSKASPAYLESSNGEKPRLLRPPRLQGDRRDQRPARSHPVAHVARAAGHRLAAPGSKNPCRDYEGPHRIAITPWKAMARPERLITGTAGGRSRAR